MRRRHRPRRPELRVPLRDRLPAPPDIMPSKPRTPLLAPPPRPTRDALTWLLAATGLVLAGRRDLEVEVLPGKPTTVIFCARGQAHAAFILPVAADEVRRALGRPPAAPPDHAMDRLWEEDREVMPPDVALDRAREGEHAC